MADYHGRGADVHAYTSTLRTADRTNVVSRLVITWFSYATYGTRNAPKNRSRMTVPYFPHAAPFQCSAASTRREGRLRVQSILPALARRACPPEPACLVVAVRMPAVPLAFGGPCRAEPSDPFVPSPRLKRRSSRDPNQIVSNPAHRRSACSPFLSIVAIPRASSKCHPVYNPAIDALSILS